MKEKKIGIMNRRNKEKGGSKSASYRKKTSNTIY